MKRQTLVNQKLLAHQLALTEDWTIAAPDKKNENLDRDIMKVGQIMPKNLTGQFNKMVNELIPSFLQPIFDVEEETEIEETSETSEDSIDEKTDHGQEDDAKEDKRQALELKIQ